MILYKRFGRIKNYLPYGLLYRIQREKWSRIKDSSHPDVYDAYGNRLIWIFLSARKLTNEWRAILDLESHIFYFDRNDYGLDSHLYVNEDIFKAKDAKYKYAYVSKKRIIRKLSRDRKLCDSFDAIFVYNIPLTFDNNKIYELPLNIKKVEGFIREVQCNNSNL